MNIMNYFMFGAPVPGPDAGAKPYNNEKLSSRMTHSILHMTHTHVTLNACGIRTDRINESADRELP